MLLFRKLLIILLNVSILLPASAGSLKKQLQELEHHTSGKVGIYAINISNNQKIGHRSNERFATQCTAKVMLVAAVLKKSMTTPKLLSKQIKYSKNELTNWNPVTEKHLAEGMSVSQLCDAALRYSDNTAARLLVKEIGGLASLNQFVRGIPDTTYRQDHNWPEEAYSGGPGNIKDSSTPRAMAETLEKLAFSAILAPMQQSLLLSWMIGNTTGNERIRAGVPKSWKVGEKTGTGVYYGITNDMGILWPPGCKPIVLVVYYENQNKLAKKRDDVIADATRYVIEEFAKSDQCIKKNLK